LLDCLHPFATSLMTQQQLAAEFRRLHTPGPHSPLILANAWDCMSARLVEEAGAAAIATTSAGVSWALGHPDGHGLTRDAMIDAVRRMVHSVRVPVTADIEAGYGAGTPDDVAETVTRVIDAGAVGVNIEDSPGHNGATLMDISYQSSRFRSARAAAQAAGVDVWINARIDTYLKTFGDDAESRFDETVRRAKAYIAAGADSAFVPLVTDAQVIERLVAAVGAPLNVLAGPGAPTIATLRALGVARVSVGPWLARSVLEQIRRATSEVMTAGTYDALKTSITSQEANALFAARP
jgi:2-methylisocitrate lyase-like PEP mutase family enzyme